jgi:hypothetical protein
MFRLADELHRLSAIESINTWSVLHFERNIENLVCATRRGTPPGCASWISTPYLANVARLRYMRMSQGCILPIVGLVGTTSEERLGAI